MKFPSEQLSTFAAVLSEGTLEAAARTLHITPSAVSQRLKALEQTAGRVLLQRATRPNRRRQGRLCFGLPAKWRNWRLMPERNWAWGQVVRAWPYRLW